MVHLRYRPSLFWNCALLILSILCLQSVYAEAAIKDNSTSSDFPSQSPAHSPTDSPTKHPSRFPSVKPSLIPTGKPSITPSLVVSISPSQSSSPSNLPSNLPSISNAPTMLPSSYPSQLPTVEPSSKPSYYHSVSPTITSIPSVNPSTFPTSNPTFLPTGLPSTLPTSSTLPSETPSLLPSNYPSSYPTSTPTLHKSIQPSLTMYPTLEPSQFPSSFPTSTVIPSTFPSNLPTYSTHPTIQPTQQPSLESSVSPTLSPSSFPSIIPTLLPSISPSIVPTSVPSIVPSIFPSAFPTWSDCVSMITTCLPWSEVIGDTYQNETVTIPCEMCVTMEEFTQGEVLDLEGGLDIEGRLELPNGTNVTIRTPFIFVQGELYMRAIKKIDGNPLIRVNMTGTENVIFYPHVRNKVRIKNGANVGKKVILVAGGQIDIQAFPEYSPTWENANHVKRDDPPLTLDFEKPQFNHACKTEYLNELDSNVMAKQSDGYEIFGMKGKESLECNIVQNKTYLFNSEIRFIVHNKTNSTAKMRSESGLYLAYLHKGDMRRKMLLATIAPVEAVADGKWFQFQGSFELNEEQAKSYNHLIFDIPNGSIDIELASFEIISPPIEAYPDPANVCKNLAINGDAERDKYPFPMTSMMMNTKLQIKEEANGNHFFHLGGRREFWSTLTFDLTPSCLLENNIYFFSARIWIHSKLPVRSAAALKVTNQDDSFFFKMIKLCPASSESIGWIDCNVKVLMNDEKFLAASKVQFILSPKDDNIDDIDMDDISFTFIRGEEQVINFQRNITHAWAPGAKVLVTSQTFNWDEDELLEIKSVDGDGNVMFTGNFSSPLSLEEDSNYAGEYALLSRNIVFDIEHDDEKHPYHGGHLMIYKTPHCAGAGIRRTCDGYAHHIDGVAFHHFGQEGLKSRYPINVYQGKDSRETTLRWNTFQDSYHRCININKSSQILVEGNVAYNTAGNCYTIETVGATKNEFIKNLGARTKKTVNSALSGWAEKDNPATFVTREPSNTFKGNVAAGSEGVGFWFHMEWNSKGVLESFEDNVAHSNAHNAIQVFPSGWDSKSPSVFKNTRVYRNRGIGWYCHFGMNFVIEGGIFADNRIGIDINYCDAVKVKQTKVIGYSKAYENHSATHGLKRHCWNGNYAVYGIRTHPNNKHTREKGSELVNVDFSRYQADTGCETNKAIIMNDDRDIDEPIIGRLAYNVSVDSRYVFKDITYDEPIQFPIHENLMDFCALNATGIDDMYISDSGSLNPAGNGYGFIVNDHPNMTMWSEKCYDLKDTCAKYCTGPGSCMTKVTLGVDIQKTEDVKLYVYDAGKNLVRGVDGIAIHDPAQFESRRFYWFYLPSGNYTGIFKVDGDIVWPTFVETMTYHPHKPNCLDHEFKFELSVPEVPEGFCDDLAINGDLESGNIGSNRFFYSDQHWFHRETSGLVVVPGYEGGQAIQTDGRSDYEHGIYHFLDTRCFVMGKRYEIEARVKLDEGCDPYSKRPGRDRCPRASIRSRHDGWDLDIEFALGETLSPVIAGEWSKLFGMFTMTQDMVDSDNVALFFEGPNKKKDFAVDALTITPVIEQCENLIFNADLEIEDHRYWSFMGDGTGLQVIDNSKYGELGHSLSTVNRKKFWNGISQEFLSHHCMKEGMILEVGVRYRLENNDGEEMVCNPALKYSGRLNSCPTFGLRVVNRKRSLKHIDFGRAIGPYKKDDWNIISGHFEVTKEMMDAKYLDIYVSGASPSVNIIIDDMIFKEADENTFGLEVCPENLVLNGDAEIGDARSWFIKGSGGFGDISLVDGAGSSKYAFHHSGRSANYQGLWQYLDQDCMKVGSEWMVSAHFRLFDENGDGTSCDPTILYNTPNALACPTILFQSHTVDRNLLHSEPLLSERTTLWVADSWNSYQAVFTMTDAHKVKDSTWFVIYNVPEGYSYSVDNIRISNALSAERLACDDLIMNNKFETRDSSYWKWVGQGIQLQTINDSIYGETGYSLSTGTRNNYFDGISQEILKRHCMEEGMTLKAKAYFRLESSDGAPLSCDPHLYYSGRAEACPTFGMKITKTGGSPSQINFGSAVGPFKENAWNMLRGNFEVTKDMIDAESFEIYVSGSTPEKVIIIDKISLKEAKEGEFESCPATNLVKNGDGEIGDSRDWYIKGNSDFGFITMVDGADGSSYAFHHSDRTEHYHGLWQHLNQDCMNTGTKWVVSAQFQLFDENGNGIPCDPTIRFTSMVAVACPVIQIQSHTEGRDVVQTKPLLNDIHTEWKGDQWNSYSAVFEMTRAHKRMDSTWFFVQNVDKHHSYSIDNINIHPA